VEGCPSIKSWLNLFFLIERAEHNNSAGMNQARALGHHWKSTPITAVYCSDLKRAHTTAQQLVAPRSTEDAITPVANPLLREQNFGVAEGKPWAAEPSAGTNMQLFTSYSDIKHL
jgi:hypothetical protein